MGSNQGVMKLKKGYSRLLNKSEMARRYIFISHDRTFNEVFGSDIEFYIQGVSIGVKRIDKFGRIIGMKEVVDDIGSRDVHFSAEKGRIDIKY